MLFKKKRKKLKVLSHVRLWHQVAKDLIGFFTAKETANKMKRQLLTGRKYLQMMLLTNT